MSRIGKLPIKIPAGVTVSFKDGVVTVKGAKGEMSQAIDPSIIVRLLMLILSRSRLSMVSTARS